MLLKNVFGTLLCLSALAGAAGCAKEPHVVDDNVPPVGDKLARTSRIFLEEGSNKKCQGDADCPSNELCHPERDRCFSSYPNPRMLDISLFKVEDRCMVANLYFPFDSAELVEDAKRWLQYDVRCIKSTDAKELVLEGHADSRGASDYNQKLSMERAESVKNQLIQAGLDLPIRVEGAGERQPARTGRSEKDYAFNRRVEFRLK